MNHKPLKTYFFVISIFLFIASLTQDCYCLDGYTECMESIGALLWGWIGVLYEIGFIVEMLQGTITTENYQFGTHLSWLANPFLIIAFVTFNFYPKVTILLSSVSTLFMLSFLLVKSVIVDEAGHYCEIKTYQAGYYLWQNRGISHFFVDLNLFFCKTLQSLYFYYFLLFLFYFILLSLLLR